MVAAGLFMRTSRRWPTGIWVSTRTPSLLVNLDVSTSAVDKEEWGQLYERLREAAAACPA